MTSSLQMQRTPCITLLRRARFLSTSSIACAAALYPFPTHPRPTPHQIFHLPSNASQKDIKARYYELVRLHHPDSAQARSLPPGVAHSRFNSITSAYDVLRGKTSAHSDDPLRNEIARRRRHYNTAAAGYHGYRTHAGWSGYSSEEEGGASSYAHTNGGKAPSEMDNRMKVGVIALIAVMSFLTAMIPISTYPSQDRNHQAAAANLAEARREARELAEVRRAALLKGGEWGNEHERIRRKD